MKQVPDLISEVIEHHALGLVLKVTTTRLYKPCPVWIISATYQGPANLFALNLYTDLDITRG